MDMSDNFQWTPRGRLIAYLAPFVLAAAGVVLFKRDMPPLSWLAAFWMAAMLWSLGFMIVAFWSARRRDAVTVSRRTLRGEMFRRNMYGSVGDQSWFDQ